MTNPAAHITCPTCGGSGWNQAIKQNPVDIEARLTGDRRSLEALKRYFINRVCCPDCAGTGKVTPSS